MAAANLLVPMMEHLRAGVYTCAAGGTVLLYDILITIEEEKRLVWPSQFSLVNCLYFANRYLPVPVLILGMYHLANLRGPLSTDGISLATSTWLLVIRVLALYGGNKWIAIWLYAIFISSHLASISMTIFIVKGLWGGLSYMPFMGLCLGKGMPVRILGFVYITPVICELVLVGMQLFHAYRHNHYHLRAQLTPLLRTLYVDGFAYFVVVAGLRLWSALIFTLADVSYWNISSYIELALISISVSRLVLHLRRSAEAHRARYLLTTSMPLSTLDQSPDQQHHRRKPSEGCANGHSHSLSLSLPKHHPWTNGPLSQCPSDSTYECEHKFPSENP